MPNDPRVRRGLLSNGVEFYVRENRRPQQRAELRLVIRVGSLQEDDDQLGLAHFVEHMAFNGTRHFAKQELIEYLQSIGMRFGADLNAFTSFDRTVYTLQVPTDDSKILERALLILSDWASGLTLEEEEIDRERGVVLEEWRRGRGAGTRVSDQQIPVLFRGSRYPERLPIGKPEVLEKFEPDALRRFYRDWYRPDLMAVIAVGDFDSQKMERRIRRRFSRLKRARDPRTREDNEIPAQADIATSIVTDPELSRSNVQLSFKFERDPGDTVGHARRGLVEGLFQAMLNARLGERAQEAEPPFISGFSSLGRLTRRRGIYSLSATSADGGLLAGLEALLVEAERARRHGFQASELERARTNFMRAVERSHQERDKTNSSVYASAYVSHFTSDRAYPSAETELALAQELVPSVSLADVNAQATRWIGSPDRVLLTTAPDTEPAKPPAEAEMLALLDRMSEIDVEPYSDRVAESPLLATEPEPGEIVKRRTLESLGVHEWTLSNGVQVVLKPTDFKNDQVLFSAFSPGGHSLVENRDHVAAVTATSILGLSGLGDHDLIQLQKLLTGKAVRVSPFIGELSEGVSGGGSPEDLETLFQLIYLNFTAPRRDADAYQSFVNRSRGLIANQEARPEWVFGKTIGEVMSQKHFRRRPFDQTLLDETDLESSYRVYVDRFSDASDFTFVFVGSFSLEGIEPLIARYLASLPTIDRKETWRDVGVRRPHGVIERVVSKGLEPKARVTMLFTGVFEQSRQNRYDLQAMTELLRERLRKKLREELGGTYGVSVGASTSHDPLEQYTLTVGFTCDPDKVEILTSAAQEELRRVRDEAADGEEVSKIQEAQRRSRETAVRENGFWLGSLGFSYRRNEDPHVILSYEDRVSSLKAEAIQKAAQRYIDFDNVARFVLLPEASAPDG